MPPPTPPSSEQSTVSEATEPKRLRPKGQKRKGVAATASENSVPRSKRIKTETGRTVEQVTSKPTGTAVDSVYDAIITVKVGGPATSFGLHRGLLRRVSKFFREELAVDETVADGVSAQVLLLFDEDVDIFRRFKNWLYCGRIISEIETNKDLAWSDLIAVYAFADRKGIPQLMNTCIDTVIQKRKEGGLFPSQADVNTLWKESGQVFRLRRLLLDQFATSCNLTHAIAHNGSYHPRFLQGLVQTLYNMKEDNTIYDPIDFWKKRKNYYVDDNENPILVD